MQRIGCREGNGDRSKDAAVASQYLGCPKRISSRVQGSYQIAERRCQACTRHRKQTSNDRGSTYVTSLPQFLFTTTPRGPRRQPARSRKPFLSRTATASCSRWSVLFRSLHARQTGESDRDAVQQRAGRQTSNAVLMWRAIVVGAIATWTPEIPPPDIVTVPDGGVDAAECIRFTMALSTCRA